MPKTTTILAFIILILASSCLSRIEKEGYIFDQEVTKKLTKGVSTKADVLHLMGSPTTISDFDDEVWIYYSQETKSLLFFKPKIIKREVMVINFLNNNKISKVENYDLSDEKDINFSDKFTTVKGHEKGMIREFFGNIGQVGAM